MYQTVSQPLPSIGSGLTHYLAQIRKFPILTQEEETSFAYKVGVQFRNRPGNFDGGSNCGHMEEEDGNKDIRFTCDVDCGGGGIEIAMAKDNKSAIVHLEVIGVYDRKHPKREPITLGGSVHAEVFRLDRVDISECAELLPGRKEVASLQRK